jgi:HEAT repeat protein
MTDTGDRPVRELRLSSAEEFLAALRSPDMGIRLATLYAICERPEKAAAFGAVNGRDVVDELSDTLAAARPSQLRTAIAAALFSLDDRRAFEQARRMFGRESDLEILRMAGSRIAREGDSMALDCFLPFLEDDSDLRHKRVAARLLAGRCGLPADKRLRVALLAGECGAQPPELAPGTLEMWLCELKGEFQPEARGFLEASGEASFSILKGNWPNLDPETKSWLVSWGASDFPERSVGLIVAALSEEDSEPRRAACAAILQYENSEIFQAPLSTVPVDRRDKPWTLASIRCGLPLDGDKSAVFTEKDRDIRLALIYRLSKRADAAPELVKLLEDGDWVIRAAATDALVSLGDPACAAVSALSDHEDIALRTAVSQVLIRLAGEDRPARPDPEEVLCDLAGPSGH